MEPASIRYKNPGAMWGRTGPRPSADKMCATNAPIPKKWGSKVTYYLSDGMGQGNNIAAFDTWVDGICAQLDLWRTSKNYRNKKFEDAIAVWSGHNHVESYIQYVLARVPGMTRTTVMDDEFWRGPMGLAFLKAQAGHEAGKTYPAPTGDWVEAQRRVFSGVKPITKSTSTAVVVATGTTGAATAAAQSGASITQILMILVFGALVAGFFVWWFHFRKKPETPTLAHLGVVMVDPPLEPQNVPDQRLAFPAAQPTQPTKPTEPSR